MTVSVSLLLLATATTLASAACISSGDQNTVNQALSSGGKGALIQLCPSAVITISDAIVFTDEDQEISTEGYPTGDTRAVIQLDAKGGNAATLIQGGGKSYARVLNVQVDGQRSKNGFQHGILALENEQSRPVDPRSPPPMQMAVPILNSAVRPPGR